MVRKVKEKEEDIFATNPSKASAKVALSSTMVGALFFILTLILTLGPDKFDKFVIFQIIMAIPFLFVSILTYSKIAYHHNNRWWDMMGWFTVNVGNGFLLNTIGLMVSTIDRSLALIYFITLAVLMLIYSLINVYHTKHHSTKLFKYLFFLAILLFGGVLPLFFK